MSTLPEDQLVTTPRDERKSLQFIRKGAKAGASSVSLVGSGSCRRSLDCVVVAAAAAAGTAGVTQAQLMNFHTTGGLLPGNNGKSPAGHKDSSLTREEKTKNKHKIKKKEKKRAIIPVRPRKVESSPRLNGIR